MTTVVIRVLLFPSKAPVNITPTITSHKLPMPQDIPPGAEKIAMTPVSSVPLIPNLDEINPVKSIAIAMTA